MMTCGSGFERCTKSVRLTISTKTPSWWTFGSLLIPFYGIGRSVGASVGTVPYGSSKTVQRPKSPGFQMAARSSSRG